MSFYFIAVHMNEDIHSFILLTILGVQMDMVTPCINAAIFYPTCLWTDKQNFENWFSLESKISL